MEKGRTKTVVEDIPTEVAGYKVVDAVRSTGDKTKQDLEKIKEDYV